MRLLITSGATREPIDGVRFISNFSTGRTGAALADFFSGLGFDVTYLRGEGAAEPSNRCEIIGYMGFEELNGRLKQELAQGRYFAVIHLAAVSDYSVRTVMVGDKAYSPGEIDKIDSSEELGLVLKRNFKIVDQLKKYAGSHSECPLVIAFKLTNASDRESGRRAAGRVVASRAADAVVHNDLAQMRDGSGVHRFEFFKARGGELGESVPCAGTEELGTVMVQWFKERMGECEKGGPS